MSTAHNDPTNGRVYGGDTGLIHIEDGNRASIGFWLAQCLDEKMRKDAINDVRRNKKEAREQSLCPGCYMVAIFNAAVSLATRNGQSLRELGVSMSLAFRELALDPDGDNINIESIGVVLDPHEPALQEEDMGMREWENIALAKLLIGGGFAWPL
jgi:hypothetical protein